MKRNVSGKVKSMKKNGVAHVGQLKKLKILGENVKVIVHYYSLSAFSIIIYIQV